MSQARIHYTARENRDLVRIDNCDLEHSQFDLSRAYSTGVALDVMAEISDHLLPLAEVNERYFRLMTRVLEFLRAQGEAGVWQAVTYFEVWAVRLSGIMPEMRLSDESTAILAEVLTTPVGEMTAREWKRETASDLRRALMRLVEGHVERRLLAAPMLEDLT